MSVFRVIVVILCGFYPFLLLGMEKEQKIATFKYSNPYFDPELQKTLLLLMQKNSDHEKSALPKDVILMISEKNYDLHCDQLFNAHQKLKSNKDIKAESFEQFWKPHFEYVNNESRLKIFEGKKIEIDDFDFITMSDEGRNIFYNLTRAALALTKMNRSTVDSVYSDLSFKERSALGSWHENGLNTVSSVEYNTMLKLPERLRAKFGKMCIVYVKEEKTGMVEEIQFLAPEEVKKRREEERQVLGLTNDLSKSVQLDHFSLRNRA